jgi:sugar O-acyltransferase (sialic acid O-acetyltransferase NeuD family)
MTPRAKKKKIFVYGASGHAKAVLDVIERQNTYQVAFLVDDKPALKGKELFGYPVVGGKSDLLRNAQRRTLSGCIVAIGENAIRLKIGCWLADQGFQLVSTLHPSAQIGRGVKINAGTVVMAGCCINPDSRIGSCVIVNTGATIDHDCMIADGVHIAPGCHLCGHVQIGKNSFLGAGSIVVPNVTVGADVIVGAGSTVLRDVQSGKKVAGSPCRVIG